MRKILIMAGITAILAMLSMSMTGCKKTVEQDTAYYQASQEAIDYLVLPVGRYFIYRDSVMGKTDSVVVRASGIQKLYIPAHLSPGFFGMGPYLVPAYYTDSLILRMTNESDTAGSSWLLINQIHNSGPSYYYDNMQNHGWGMAFWSPATKIFVNNDRNGGFLVPSMTVEGTTYNNVLRFLSTVDTAGNPSYHRSDYYWAKGVGLIRKEIITGTEVHVWTLLRKG